MKNIQTYVLVVALIVAFLPPLVSAQWLETTIPVGLGPWDLVYNPTDNKIYCANWGSDNVTIIDGATNAVIATLPVGSDPFAFTYNSTNNKVYSANDTDLTVIDGAGDTVLTTIGDFRVNALIYNPNGNKVYCAGGPSGQGADVTVIDGASDSIIAALISYGGVIDFALNAIENKVYCCHNPQLTVIDCVPDTICATLFVGWWPRKLIFDSNGNEVYCVNAVSQNIVVIDCVADTIVTEIPTSDYGFDLTYNSLNNKVYCLDFHEVMVIDGLTDTVITTIAVGMNDGINAGLIYNSTNNKVYCANYLSNDVTVIDGEGDTVITTIGVGAGPHAMAWNYAQNRTYVANYYDNTVSVIRDVTGVEENKISVVEDIDLGATIFRGLLQLPGGKQCKVFDIMGRIVEPDKIRPGIYFIEVDGVVTQKVVKVK